MSQKFTGDNRQSGGGMSRYLRISDPTAVAPENDTHVFDPGVTPSELFTIDRRQVLNARPGECLAEMAIASKARGETWEAPTTASIRSHFERLWGFGSGVTQDGYEILKQTQGSETPVLFKAFDTESRVCQIPMDDLSKTVEFDAKRNALVLSTRPCRRDEIEASQARFYIVTLVDATRLDDVLAAFGQSYVGYDAFWNDCVISVELACPMGLKNKAHTALLPGIEILDLSGPRIWSLARRIAARKAISSRAAANADTVFTAEKPDDVLSVESVEQRTDSYLKIKSLDWAITEQWENLVSQAASLGYKLKLDPGTFAVSLDAIPPKMRIWHTKHLRESPATLETLYEAQGRASHSFAVCASRMEETKPSEDPTDVDPWVEKENSLNLEGFVHVHRFERSTYGYVCGSGRALEEVMNECARDDFIRRSTALLLPVEEQTLTQGIVTTRYLIVRRPLPGINTVTFPSAAVYQNWTYRSALASAEVGELISTVSLAPGESRKLNVTRNSEYRSETKSTTTSLLDVTDSRSTDLVSEVERESRREKEAESSFTLNSSYGSSASLGLSLGDLSIGGGSEFSIAGSGSRKFSTKDFDRALDRTVQKTASSMQRRQKDEVSLSTSIVQSTATSDSRETLVKNINEGRTLNLLLFAVNKRMTTGLRLNAMSLVAYGTRELVEGTGVLPWRVAPLSNGGVNDIAAFMWKCGLPAHLETRPGGEDLLNKLVTQSLCDGLKEVLVDDLAPDGIDDSDYAAGSGRNFVVALPPEAGTKSSVTSYRQITANLLESDVAPGAATKPPVISFREKSVRLENLVYGNRSMSSRVVYYPTSATYLDAQVGAMPATESYYEQMRAEEVRQRRASSYRDFASGLLDESKARWISRGQLGSVGGPLTLLETKIVSIDFAKGNLKEFTLGLSDDLPKGTWKVMFGKSFVIDVPKACVGSKAVRLVCSQDQLWLDQEDRLKKLALVNLDACEAIMSASHDLSAYFPWLYELAFRTDDNCGEPML